MTVAAARHAVNDAALARDRVALVALGASLPATTAYAYERHRARAYAHALGDSGDAALGELAVAAAVMPPSAAVLAADGAAVHLLLGNPARSIGSIALAARNDVQFDAFGRAVLLAATRQAPTEWRRAARAAALARHPRAAFVALAAAFNAMGDRRAYRLALATIGLLTALFALLALPTLLVDGGTSIAGVTAPSFAVPPSVVVVPARTPPPRQRTPAAPDAVSPASVPSQATLVSATPQPPASAPPGRPRAVRPGTASGPSPAPPGATPAPAPTPAPGRARPAARPAAGAPDRLAHRRPACGGPCARAATVEVEQREGQGAREAGGEGAEGAEGREAREARCRSRAARGGRARAGGPASGDARNRPARATNPTSPTRTRRTRPGSRCSSDSEHCSRSS